MKWEYKVLTVNRNYDPSEKVLNELGEEGWELVSSHQLVKEYSQISNGMAMVPNGERLIFKRVKNEGR